MIAVLANVPIYGLKNPAPPLPPYNTSYQKSNCWNRTAHPFPRRYNTNIQKSNSWKKQGEYEHMIKIYKQTF